MMRNLLVLVCFFAVVTSSTLAVGADAFSESTYFLGRADTRGKNYDFCRRLSVKMLLAADGSCEFVYSTFDDSGKSLGSEPLKLTRREFRQFASISYQAWKLIGTHAKEPLGQGTFSLKKFRGENAVLSGCYDASYPTLKLWVAPLEGFQIPAEGVCATLELLSQTDAGKKIVGVGNPYRAGLRKQPVSMPFTEQEEIEISGSIIDRYKARDWGNWLLQVEYGKIDFRMLTKREIEYLTTKYSWGTTPRERRRIDFHSPDVIRLKLGGPKTLQALHDSLHAAWVDGERAAEACEAAANPDLIPVAAELLFTDKPAEAPSKDFVSDVVADWRPSVHAAVAIMSLIKVCPEFPEKVRKAAKSWGRYPSDDYPDFVEPCREWWKENKDRIKRRAYSEVTPPRTRK
jgi:hypothetical protein